MKKLPCRHCGCRRVWVRGLINGLHVECPRCGARGPSARWLISDIVSHDDLAQRLWNRQVVHSHNKCPSCGDRRWLVYHGDWLWVDSPALVDDPVEALWVRWAGAWDLCLGCGTVVTP